MPGPGRSPHPHADLARKDDRQRDSGAVEQLRNIDQREAHAAQGLDAVQSRDVISAVQPIAAVGAPCRVQQPDAVVVVQRANGKTCAPGQLADFEKHAGSIHGRWRRRV